MQSGARLPWNGSSSSTRCPQTPRASARTSQSGVGSPRWPQHGEAVAVRYKSAMGWAERGMPIAYALTFGFTEIAELLADFGAQLDLRFAAGLGRFDVVKKGFVNRDASLKPDAGRLADPYENRFRCERTRANIPVPCALFRVLTCAVGNRQVLLELGADVNQELPGVNQ